MDNYRRPMYTRSKMGSNQGQQYGCGYTPIMDAVKDDRCMKREENCVDKLPLAMAYVPFQKWRNVYDASAGLQAGTIFQELDLPWLQKCSWGERGDRYGK